jgi:hypothetical protein
MSAQRSPAFAGMVAAETWRELSYVTVSLDTNRLVIFCLIEVNSIDHVNIHLDIVF